MPADKTLPPLKEIFPYDYQGGGYFRMRGVPKGETAPILHGQQAVEFLYDKIKEALNPPDTHEHRTPDC